MSRTRIKAHASVPVVETFTAAEETTADTEQAAALTYTLETIERGWRDAELLITDYWGLSDQTMTAAMTTYRQELRDMPDLAGFPASHTRPTL